MIGLTSAASLVGYLSEPDYDLQAFALQRLNDNIDLLWTEIVGNMGQIEALYEDESFPQRQLAALVAAKVYYQLQEYSESMNFALGAGDLFDIENAGEFEETILAKCIDAYISLSAARNISGTSSTASQHHHLSGAFPNNTNGSATSSASLNTSTTPFSQHTQPSKSLLSRQYSSSLKPSPSTDGYSENISLGGRPVTLPKNVQKNLQVVIRRIIESCYEIGAYRQVVGIAVEARNLDMLREVMLNASLHSRSSEKKNASASAGGGEEIMEYVLDICMNLVQERALRDEILRLILDLLNEIPNPDYFSISKCAVYLDQHTMASNILRQLVDHGDHRSLLAAYQISFDLYDNGTQDFLAKLIEELPTVVAAKEEERPHANGDIHVPSGADKHAQDAPQASDTDLLADVASTAVVVNRTKQRPLSEAAKTAFSLLQSILRGTKSIELNREFLFRNNRTDRNTLNKIRDSLEGRNSIFHSALTFSNAFMHSGTTNDTFLRENLEWLGKAVNWSKLSATAALGVIHRGNLGEGQRLLEPYLPKENAVPGSPYSQGGSLYALGLIYSNHGHHVMDYLRDNFKRATEEVVQHGGALGLGVAGMGTGSEEVYEELRSVLYSDSAINGEAVGISMGLIMLGTGSVKALEDMIQYAHDTQHEKIIRGLAMGMALIMYARQEAADELINGLLYDPDPTLRYGGILTVALAYCGTGNNKAVRKLLHVAVSDVSDDVRRIAVLSLGFLLFRKPGSVPRMVELLAESYNPHVRYGAAMALGIACAGTGLEEAVDLLEPMMKDSTDFVRQGAYIALAMILVQQNETMNPKVVSIRKIWQKTIGDRHEDAMAKFGCALALGIIDVGGRNCTIGLQTRTGNLNMAAIVGMAVFTQYWYWFPLAHFLSLSFTPTAIIGVDHDLEVPSFKFHCAARPSMFDYPPTQEVKAEEAPEKVKTAVLSTTAQAKRRKLVKERQQRRESMDIDQTTTTPRLQSADEDRMDIDEQTQQSKEETKDQAELASEKPEDESSSSAQVDSLKRKIEREKVGYELENMSRVLPAQLKTITFPEGRYSPIKKPTGGVILMVDNQPGEPKTLMELMIRKAAESMPSAETAQRAGDETSALQVGIISGAAAAAGVLTAVDEDEEGDQEADLPTEFDYHSDADFDSDA